MPLLFLNYVLKNKIFGLWCNPLAVVIVFAGCLL